MAGLSTCDYERMLDLAVTIMETPADATPWPIVLREVVNSLNCTVGIIADVRSTSPGNDVAAWSSAWGEQVSMAEFLRADAFADHPLLRHYAVTNDNAALAVSDLVSDRDWQATRAYVESCSAFGAFRQIAVPLLETQESRFAIALGRPGKDFTDRERAYLLRLQPLLAAVQAQRGQQVPDVGEDHGLTARELTVLGLLAEGLTAEAIGRRLAISPRTVHRHLEHVYRKLNVTDRLAAVLRAQRSGLLPTG